jgi:hypothetical protein
MAVLLPRLLHPLPLARLLPPMASRPALGRALPRQRMSLVHQTLLSWQ